MPVSRTKKNIKAMAPVSSGRPRPLTPRNQRRLAKKLSAEAIRQRLKHLDILEKQATEEKSPSSPMKSSPSTGDSVSPTDE